MTPHPHQGRSRATHAYAAQHTTRWARSARSPHRRRDAARDGKVNVTVYAVAAPQDLTDCDHHQQTEGAAARDAAATVELDGTTAFSAAAMVLTGGEPGNGSLSAATLGGAATSNDAPGQRTWSPVKLATPGTVQVVVASHHGRRGSDPHIRLNLSIACLTQRPTTPALAVKRRRLPA